MSKVAFLGLGAMGSLMAHNLLKAGHELTVWNREPKAMESLIAAGARAASEPRTAAQDQDFVCTMVRDNEASKQVWLDHDSGALLGMKKGGIAIESSTLSPDWVRELNVAVTGAGFSLLDAMVSGSTPQAESAELVFLVGDDADAVKKAEPLLKAMGTSVQYAGPVGTGSLAKLCTNTLMAAELAVLAELVALLKSQHVDPDEVLSAVAATPLWSPHMTADKQSMLSSDFQPHFPIKLLQKDLDYMLDTAGNASSIPSVTFIRSQFRKAIDKGLGDLNMTAILKLVQS